jgi:hypothetical protein
MLAFLGMAWAEPEFHMEAGGQFTPYSLVFDTAARMDGEHDGYIMAAARVDPYGVWLGRAGVGIDVFGGAEGLDLKLGLFMGATGDLSDRSLWGRPALGGELQLGVKIGRVYGFYRHLDGFAGPLEDRLSENEFRLGFEVHEHVRLHGQFVVFNPGDRQYQAMPGIGAEVVF